MWSQITLKFIRYADNNNVTTKGIQHKTVEEDRNSQNAIQDKISQTDQWPVVRSRLICAASVIMQFDHM